MPILSIIVPVYNAEKHLPDCLHSILNQQFSDFELLLVDDGSSDRSGDICEEFATSEPRIRVIHKNNEGLVKARTAGLSVATGEYVGFVDADDWIDSDMFSKLCATAVAHDADIVGCDFLKEWPETRLPGGGVVPPGVYDRDALIHKVFPKLIMDGTSGGYGVSPAVWFKLFRKTLLDRVLPAVPDHLRNGEDGAITYPALLASSRGCLMQDRIYHYRMHPEQMSRGFDLRHGDSLLMWTVHMRASADVHGVDVTDQIDYYAQYKVAMLLSAQLDEGRVPDPARGQMLMRLAKSETIRHALARQGLGQLPIEAKVAFIFLGRGSARGAVAAYLGTRMLKRSRTRLHPTGRTPVAHSLRPLEDRADSASSES